MLFQSSPSKISWPLESTSACLGFSTDPPARFASLRTLSSIATSSQLTLDAGCRNGGYPAAASPPESGRTLGWQAVENSRLRLFKIWELQSRIRIVPKCSRSTDADRKPAFSATRSIGNPMDQNRTHSDSVSRFLSNKLPRRNACVIWFGMLKPRYVFKFVGRNGLLEEALEYANPVTYAKLVGHPLG